MIRINLLPYQKVEVIHKGRNLIIVFLVYVAVIIGAIVWYNSHLNGTIGDLNAKIDYTRKELIRFQKIVAKVKKIQEQLDQLNQKLAVIEELNAGRGKTFRLLDHMTGMIIKDRMWLTNFEAKQRVRVIKKGKGKKAEKEEKIETHLTIQGIALDDKTVADFMTQLETAKTELGEEPFHLYSDVKLVTLQRMTLKPNKAMEAINLKRFQVTCQEEQAALAKLKAEKAGTS